MNNDLLCVITAWSRIKDITFENLPSNADHDKIDELLNELGNKINFLKKRLEEEKIKKEEEDSKSIDEVGYESGEDYDNELNNFITKSYIELNYLAKSHEILIEN
jgi:hypothetical protein